MVVASFSFRPHTVGPGSGAVAAWALPVCVRLSMVWSFSHCSAFILTPLFKHLRIGMSHHPSALRNRGPISEVLVKILPRGKGHQGPYHALEIGSGTGAHLELFAEKLPHFSWQPSEYVPEGTGPSWNI